MCSANRFLKSRRPTFVAALLLSLSLASLNGCHGGDHDGVRSQRRAVDLAPAAIARLEALGYETWVQERHIPKRTGVLLHEPDQAEGGFVLFANRGPCNAVLLDREGDVVQRWSGPTPGFWSDVDLADDGALFVIGATDERRENQQSARFLRKLDWDSNVLWEADFPAHHDVEVLPDGRILTLSSTVRTIQDGLVERVLLDDEVILTSPEGKVLESHSIYDAYRKSVDITQPVLALRPVTIGDSQAIDAFHSNSVAFIDVPHLEGEHPIYNKGNVLVSMRHQSRIAVLNRSTGAIVWSWGKGVLDAQHSARMLEDGNIIVFDNGFKRKSSRILEIDPRTETVVWEFGGPDPIHFYTPGGGATQRLPNGNTLITETRKGRLFEVTSEGEIVWKFVNPAVDPGQTLRATIHSSKWVPATRVLPILERLS